MKITTVLFIAALLPVGILTAACDYSTKYDQSPRVDGRVAVAAGFAEFKAGYSRVDFVHVSDNGLASNKIFTPEEGETIVNMYAGPETENPAQLFIATVPDSARQEITDPGLIIIDPVADKTRRYNTGSYFGRIAFSPDSQYGILYHDENDTVHSDGLYNPNEVALLNLRASPSDKNPAIHSMDLSGAVLHDIIFLGAVNIEGKDRNLAAFITDGRIKLVDIEDPKFASVTVTLKTESDFRTILISEIIVRPARENRDTTLFAMASGISEIFEIPLVATADGFTAPSLNQQDGGSFPTDMTVVIDDKIELLVVANLDSTVNVVTVDSGDVNTVHLQNGTTLIFSRQSDTGEELVFYGTGVSAITFCNVNRLNEDQEDAFESMYLQGETANASPLDNNRMALYPLSTNGLMILDLETHGITHLSSAYGYNWEEATLHNDIYYLPQPDGLAWLDLNTGHPDLIVFDDLVTEMMYFPQTGLGVALHAALTGRATLFPLDEPTRDAAFVSDGYLIEGVLNGEVSK